ncbi:MAG: type III-B CRISPR module RAMP protein Cmr4, partial [Mariprofundaceae bacterium]|nr:type III-B CRISPR module RAMP protein Cmr4 [Mariprofundaceae bacterium]
MGTTQTILGLRAETSIHAGTGQNNGVIDLPIQREVHTGYPCVFGSAVKGAFRAHAEVRRKDLNININQVFGSADDEGNASNVSFTDARLLLLPVRSLTGHFKLVTCPSILQRLKRDMQMMGQAAGFAVPMPDQGEVISHDSGDLFLEEFKFTQAAGLNDALIEVLEKFGAEGLKGQL